MATMTELKAAVDRLISAADQGSLAIQRLLDERVDTPAVDALIAQANGAAETLEGKISAVPPAETPPAPPPAG